MRSSATCLALLFVLSLSVLPMTHAQAPPPQTATMRLYLQSGDPTTVSWFGGNGTVFDMDATTPDGSLAECKYCSFATRPLVDAHWFRSFKLHIYMKESGSVISLGFGSAPSNLSGVSLSYWDPCRPWKGFQEGEMFGLEMTLQTAGVTVAAGKRLVLHFGSEPCPPPEIISRGSGIGGQPIFLFGDSEHASYIEVDEAELQGQPVPEFPSFLIVLPVILSLTILFRRRGNKP
jgi:hypothetical protein